MSGEEAVWLIKSGGRILGPHTLTQVAQLLRDREVTIIDEVALPARRWHLIRDHVGFQELIQKLRSEGTNVDDMVTSTGSITGSVTESMGASNPDDITEDISEYQSQMREIVYEEISERPSAAKSSPAPSRFQSAAQINSQQIRMQAERGSKWMWALTVVVLIGVAVALVAKRMMIVRDQGGMVSLDQTGVALLSYQIGDYPAALDGLKKAYAADPERKEIWYPLALLMVQLNGQTVEAKRLLQKVKDQNSESSSVVLNARGILKFFDGDFNGANEDFQQSFNEDKNNLSALANRGVVALSRRDFREADQLLNRAISGGLKEGQVAVQRLSALLQEWKDSSDKNYLLDADKLIRQALKFSANYQQELRLAQAYVALQKGDLENLEGMIRQALDVDLQQSDDFRQPIQVLRQGGDWAQLLDWCRQLKDALPDHASAVALEGVCQLKKGQIISAKAAVEKAVNQSPRDALLQAVFASILRKSSMDGESSVALGRAVELDRKSEFVTPALLQARFCAERDDQDCASLYWMKVLEISPKHPAAQVGMAQVYWSRQAKTEAMRQLQDVEAANQSYKPFSRLRRLVGGAG